MRSNLFAGCFRFRRGGQLAGFMLACHRVLLTDARCDPTVNGDTALEPYCKNSRWTSLQQSLKMRGSWKSTFLLGNFPLSTSMVGRESFYSRSLSQGLPLVMEDRHVGIRSAAVGAKCFDFSAGHGVAGKTMGHNLK